MLNVVAVVGRLVRDPELKVTQGGKTVCTFRIACDGNYKGQDGQYPVDFFNVNAWGKAAEFVSKFFTQGSIIAIDGRLQSRDYTDKQGNKRQAVEITANNISFCGGKGKKDGGSNSLDAMPPAPNEDDFLDVTAEEDIPF